MSSRTGAHDPSARFAGTSPSPEAMGRMSGIGQFHGILAGVTKLTLLEDRPAY